MSSVRRVHFSRRRPSGPLRSRRRVQPRHLARRAHLRLRHARGEALAVLAAAVALLVVATGVTVAFFTSTGSSTASATAGTLNPPTNVSAVRVANSTNVTVSWTAPTGTPAPTGYYVTRTPSGGSATAACATSPTNTLTTTSCVDAAGAGTFTYRVIAVFRSWTATSAASASVTVPAVVAPVISITHPGAAAASGYYTSWNIGCNQNTDRVCADVTSGAGNLTVQANSVKLVIKRASDNECYDGSGTDPDLDWSLQACNSPLAMTLNNGSQYRSNNLFAQGGAVDGTFTFTVSATNSANITASASVTRVFDSAAPTASISPANNGYTTGPVTITGSDLNGIASISYRVDANSGAYVTVDGPGPVTFTVDGAGSHQIDYFVTDVVGRTSATVTNSVVIRDNTAPVVTALVPSGVTGATWGDVDCTLGNTAPNSLRICATVGDNFVLGNVYYELKRSDGACYDGSGTSRTNDWGSGNCGLTTAPFLMSLSNGVYRSAQILDATYSGDTTYTVRVFASDLAGNTTSATSTFKLETGPVLSNFVPADGANYRVSGGGGSQWSSATNACASRVCVNVTDDSTIASVKYELYRVSTGTDTARCWNGTSFATNNNCTPITMTLSTGNQYVSNTIPSSLINAAKSTGTDGNWRLRITATDSLGLTTISAVQSFSFSG